MLDCFIENIWPKSKLLYESTELVELKNISKNRIITILSSLRKEKYYTDPSPCRSVVLLFVENCVKDKKIDEG